MMQSGFTGASRMIRSMPKAIHGGGLAMSTNNVATTAVRSFQTSRYQEEPSASYYSSSAAVSAVQAVPPSWMTASTTGGATGDLVVDEDTNRFDPSNFGYRVVDPLIASSPRFSSFSSLYEEDYDQYSLHMASTRGRATSCHLHPVAGHGRGHILDDEPSC